MKLELKHLAPYLPYGLSFYYESLDGKKQHSWILTSEKLDFALLCQNKPILRPISDLLNEITVNNETFIPHLALGGRPNLKDYDFVYFEKNIENLSFGLVQQLIEWHIDVFGLIDKGLAISIHEVGQVIA